MVSRAFPSFCTQTVGTGVIGAECVQPASILKQNALWSREQQLSVLIAEFMKRRYRNFALTCRPERRLIPAFLSASAFSRWTSVR